MLSSEAGGHKATLNFYSQEFMNSLGVALILNRAVLFEPERPRQKSESWNMTILHT